ncbi:exodeoxyribonuclease VII large subunit [Thermodesulfovibrio sp. 3907-1M]|uniref:Exodeoxyribonuclease 7 large subunit n=1 Tax=Thermodesulfovibrio autotrophicus TaxID=3118333 RepID=A0AAU8GV87_9BACT
MFKVDVTYQSLSQYLIEIREYIQEISDYQWIVAEIAKIDPDKNGNYWIELVEKTNNEIVAKCDAVVWSRNADTVLNFYIKTGMQLQKGIKILFLGRATFHEKHGFKISIYQIDPSFSLGEMALKKKETIERLTREGLIQRNKLLEIPVIIQRIAIVSSESAAGYEDFLKILKGNRYGFKFYTKLFDAFVQGESAVVSLMEAFQRCAIEAKAFDAVVLIRGGGSVTDLAIFNDYELAKTMALMPIPVFTGIGHTRDETVADFVASMSFKTPSEVAKFIVDKAVDFDSRLDTLKHRIIHRAESFLSVEISRNQSIEERFKLAVKNSREKILQKMNLTVSEVHNNVLKRVHSEREILFKVKQQLYKKTNLLLTAQEVEITNINNKVKMKINENMAKQSFRISSYRDSLFTKLKNTLSLKNIQIERVSEKLRLLSPENILKRGYSITYLNGKVLKNSQEVPLRANIQIQLYNGKLTAEVTRKEENNGELKLF